MGTNLIKVVTYPAYPAIWNQRWRVLETLALLDAGVDETLDAKLTLFGNID